MIRLKLNEREEYEWEFYKPNTIEIIHWSLLLGVMIILLYYIIYIPAPTFDYADFGQHCREVLEIQRSTPQWSGNLTL